ncbi:hypothetical protein KEM54_000619 [Ascosphaera aggregata]|nr:hypothetical protein KEM54_000619 [Ascosphaera aggregata]
MVRKLFSRPRSKTAGAASASSAVLHCVDALPCPDHLPVANVTTDTSAGHNNKHQPQQPQLHSQSSRRPIQPRLHGQFSGEKQQPPPLPSNSFAKRVDVLTPPSFSERKPHKLQRQHRRTAESHNYTPVNKFKIIPIPCNPHGTAQAPPISPANNKSSSEEKTERDERHIKPERHSCQATTPKRRPSKWRKMGSLLKPKDVYRDAPPLLPKAHEVPVHDAPVISQPFHAARTTLRAPQMTKTTTFRSVLTPAPSSAPMSSLGMPSLQVEGYSVMFNRVLPSPSEVPSPSTTSTRSPQRRPSALLNRREKKLQGLNLQAPSRAHSTDNLLQPGKLTGQQTPYTKSGRTLNVPPTAYSVETVTSPLRRSNTAPPSPTKEGHCLSVSQNDASATTPSSVSGSSILTHRRRSLDSIASPGFLSTDTSDGDECVEADDDDDTISLHTKAPSWEDPHEPKWEIINPRRKPVKPVVKQETTLRSRDCSRQSSRHTSRPSTASAAETDPDRSPDEPTIINATCTAESVDDSVIMQQSSGEVGKGMGKVTDSMPVHPALARLSRSIPPIPPKSPARSSISSTTSFYRSAQRSPVMIARKTSLPCLSSEQPTLSSPVILVSNHQQDQQHSPYIPSTLSSNVTYDTEPDDDFSFFEPGVVEVSVARSVSVCRKARLGQPGATNGVTFSGKGQLVRSRSRGAGGEPRRLPCASYNSNQDSHESNL